MTSIIKDWYNRNFENRELVALLLFIAGLIAVLYVFGSILMPVFVSIVIAYLLSGLITKLEKYHCSHRLSVTVVFLLFIGSGIFAIFIIFPPLWRQTATFFQELPNMLGVVQKFISHHIKRYPEFISNAQLQALSANFKSIVTSAGRTILSYSLASISSVISIILYFVLVPILVFFFLMDKNDILNWCSQFLPRQRGLIEQVWREINDQFGCYIQGRALQILIVTVISYIAYASLGLQYAMLLAVASGISVIIPYIGAVVVTVPVLLMGAFQWGWSAHFLYLVIAYIVITIFAGYILEPLLLSEAMDLHPVVIVLSILFFGGLFGFWGIFFAIPLASIIRAIINAWPRSA